MVLCVYLKMSCVSKSICSPLINSAESPGCNPRVPLKNYGKRNVTLTKYPVCVKHSAPAEQIAMLWGKYRQNQPSRSQLYCKTRGNSEHKATSHADSSKQTQTTLFKISLFGAIKPHTKQIKLSKKGCVNVCLCMCMSMRRHACVVVSSRRQKESSKSFWRSQISLQKDKDIRLILLQTLQLQQDMINTNSVHPT